MGPRLWPVGLTVLLALIVAPSYAVAAEQTFCVQDADCVGTDQPTIAAALSAAAANGVERDRIKLGSFTFSESGLFDAPGNPVIIEGNGQAETAITRPAAPGQIVLALAGFSTVVRDLSVIVPAGANGMTGMNLETGTRGERVRVASGPGVQASIGVFVFGNSSSLGGSTVSLPTDSAPANTGINVGPNGLAERSDVTGGVGVALSGGSARVRDSRIRGRTGIEHSGGPTSTSVTVENSQITSLNPLAGDAGIKLGQGAAATAKLKARHVTVVGTGSGVGVQAWGVGSDAATHADIELDDSVVVRYGVDLRAEGGSAAESSITVKGSAFDFTKVVSATPPRTSIGPIPGSNLNLQTTDSGLLSPAGDRRPAFNSPLVDRGTPGALLAGESPLDLMGLPRLVDGNGDGTGRRDIGAFEYQRSPPAVTASGAPTTATTGQAIAFTASATDADPGETPTVSWSFDDGESATGASVRHAFATPGRHTATARAVDPTGLVRSATIVVRVNAPAVPVPPGPADRSVELSIGTRRVKLTRRGVAVVRVTCPAAEVSGPCTGRLTLRTARKVRRARGAKAKRVRLGSKRFSVPAGRTTKVKVKLSRRNRRLVVRLKRVQVRATAPVSDRAGNTAGAVGRFQLRAR